MLTGTMPSMLPIGSRPTAYPPPKIAAPVGSVSVGGAVFPGLHLASINLNTPVRGGILPAIGRSGSGGSSFLTRLPTAFVPQVPLPVSSIAPTDYPALPGVSSSGGGGGGGAVEAGMLPSPVGLFAKFNALSPPVKIGIVVGLAGAVYFGMKHFKKVQIG